MRKICYWRKKGASTAGSDRGNYKNVCLSTKNYVPKSLISAMIHGTIASNTPISSAKPAQSMRIMENGHPVIAGWHNGDYGSSAPNFALDKVQLLVPCASPRLRNRLVQPHV